MNNNKKLYRSRTDKVIAGVCGGLGEYFNMDALIFRIIFLALLFAGGGGFWLYLVLAIIIPKEPLFESATTGGVDARGQFNDFVADVRASAQHWAAEIKKDTHTEPLRDKRRMWFGIIIVIIGAVALVNVLFPHSWVRWETMWPILIILFGLAIISRGNRN